MPASVSITGKLWFKSGFRNQKKSFYQLHYSLQPTECVVLVAEKNYSPCCFPNGSDGELALDAENGRPIFDKKEPVSELKEEIYKTQKCDPRVLIAEKRKASRSACR